MLSAVLLVAIGLAALLGGGEVLVRGGSALARGLGVSPLLVGMTVVAFGTSAPELGVNVTAALSGQSAISFGNVVGSSLANIGLILGLAALLRPLSVDGTTVRRELPIMVASAVLVAALALDGFQGGPHAAVGRVDGAVLLAVFAAFIGVTVHRALQDRSAARASATGGCGAGPEERLPSKPLALVMTFAGLAGVLLGSDWTVEGAVGVARQLGVDEAIIGLTIVAVGTSLPELATSLAAVRNGEVDLAIGNVVGSNIFNLLFVLGVTAMIRPVEVPPGGTADLAALIVVSLALHAAAATNQRKVLRWEGGLLLLGYSAYIVWRAAL